jgi:hypothetical protein
MVMKYLNKVGKYISNHRLLFIICVIAAFIIMANIATYIANYEYFGNYNKKEQFANHKKEKFTNENGMSNFMKEQMKNMQNSNQ